MEHYFVLRVFDHFGTNGPKTRLRYRQIDRQAGILTRDDLPYFNLTLRCDFFLLKKSQILKSRFQKVK